MKNLIKNHPINFQLWTFVWLIVTIIGMVFTITTSYNNLNNKIEKESIWNTHIAAMLDNHEDRIADNEDSTSRIEVDLQWIKATLLEIKQALK